MTSLNAQLNYATLGKKAPEIRQMMPRLGGKDNSFRNYDTTLQWKSMRGTDTPLRTIENLTNGSVRGVLPCKGIEPSGVFGTRLLRQEAGLASDSYIVPQGFAKSQQKGLAYLPQKPLNVQPQMQRQFFNVNQFARASAPPFTPTKA